MPPLAPALKILPLYRVSARRHFRVHLAALLLAATASLLAAAEPMRREWTLCPSTLEAPVVTMIHPGTHAFPRNAPALIVKFFKEHPKR